MRSHIIAALALLQLQSCAAAPTNADGRLESEVAGGVDTNGGVSSVDGTERVDWQDPDLLQQRSSTLEMPSVKGQAKGMPGKMAFPGHSQAEPGLAVKITPQGAHSSGPMERRFGGGPAEQVFRPEQGMAHGQENGVGRPSSIPNEKRMETLSSSIDGFHSLPESSLEGPVAEPEILRAAKRCMTAAQVKAFQASWSPAAGTGPELEECPDDTGSDASSLSEQD